MAYHSGDKDNKERNYLKNKFICEIRFTVMSINPILLSAIK